VWERERIERAGRLGNMMDVRTASLMASVAAFQFWDASSWTPAQVRYGREWSGRCLGNLLILQRGVNVNGMAAPRRNSCGDSGQLVAVCCCRSARPMPRWVHVVSCVPLTCPLEPGGRRSRKIKPPWVADGPLFAQYASWCGVILIGLEIMALLVLYLPPLFSPKILPNRSNPLVPLLLPHAQTCPAFELVSGNLRIRQLTFRSARRTGATTSTSSVGRTLVSSPGTSLPRPSSPTTRSSTAGALLPSNG
jgi:hypothetical protein